MEEGAQGRGCWALGALQPCWAAGEALGWGLPAPVSVTLPAREQQVQGRGCGGEAAEMGDAPRLVAGSGHRVQRSGCGRSVGPVRCHPGVPGGAGKPAGPGTTLRSPWPRVASHKPSLMGFEIEGRCPGHPVQLVFGTLSSSQSLARSPPSHPTPICHFLFVFSSGLWRLQWREGDGGSQLISCPWPRPLGPKHLLPLFLLPRRPPSPPASVEGNPCPEDSVEAWP